MCPRLRTQALARIERYFEDYNSQTIRLAGMARLLTGKRDRV